MEEEEKKKRKKKKRKKMSAPTNVTVIVNGTQATNRAGEVDPLRTWPGMARGISSSTTMAKSTMMFKWKAEDHSCTDVPCCVVFGLWWLAMIIVAGMAMNSGDPTSLLHGVDYTGNTCGSGRVETKRCFRIASPTSWKITG